MSRGFIEAGSRWINGDEVCDEVGLGRPGVLHYLAFMGHCMLVASMAWVQRFVPGVDASVINVSSTCSLRSLDDEILTV